MPEDPPAPWVNARAVAWALHEVDVPASRLATLIALASKSNGDGTPDRPKVNGWNAYPSVPTIARMAGKGARQVERDIEWFLDEGIIRMPLDQSAAEHIPGNIRPNVYDMGYSPIRPHLDPDEAKRQREGKSTRRRPRSSHDPSSATGHGQRDTEDPSPTTGHDPSSTTGRPVTHDEQDPSWVTGKELFEEEEKEPIIEPAPVLPVANPAEAAAAAECPPGHEDTRDRLRRLGVSDDDEIEQFIEHIKNTHTIRTTVGAYLTAWTDDQITEALGALRQRAAQQRHEQRQRALERARRAAIDACPHCNHHGHRHDLDHNGRAVPCDHTPPRGPQEPPQPPEPQTEAPSPADGTEAPPAGVTVAQEAVVRLREQMRWERKPVRARRQTQPAEPAEPVPATELPDCPKCGNVREPYGPCYGCMANATPLTARSVTA